MKVDGNIVKDKMVRSKREDVDRLVSPSYGGTICTPNAGFAESINMTGWSVRIAYNSN